MKKSLSSILAVLVMLLMTTAAWATANRAAINVTSEPIPQDSSCSKAGGFTVSFDDQTTFKGGDQITFDLTNNVTLCKDVDLVLAIDDVGLTNGSGFTDGYTIGLADAPITTSDLDNSLVQITDASTSGIWFRISGSQGGSRLAIDIMTDVNNDGTLDSDDTVEYMFDASAATNPASQVLTLSFLDETAYTAAGFGIAGLFTDTTVLGYSVDATSSENTICVDVSSASFTGDYVNASFDSKADKFSYNDSSPQIGHIVSSTGITTEASDKRQTGYFITPGTASQTTASCLPIDNEASFVLGVHAWCDDTLVTGATANEHVNNALIIRTTNGAAFESANYTLKLEILVNGSVGANGVYWTSEAVQTAGYDTSADALAGLGALAGIGAPAYELADGTTTGITPLGANTDSTCTIVSAAKATVLTTAEHDMNLSASNDYMEIDLPDMVYDTDVDAGDVVSVRATLNKAPCGAFPALTWEIGTAGCQSATVSTSNTLIYPYFGIGSGSYTNVMVITNRSASVGSADLTLYEDGGESFTATVSIPANSVYVTLIDSITWTGTGTQGDSRSYVVVATDFPADGVALITNASTGESVSYTPTIE